MKRLAFISLMVLMLGSCNTKTPEEEVLQVKLTIASEQSYVIGEEGLPWTTYIIRETDIEGTEWKAQPIKGDFGYKSGYEYTILAHQEVINPESIPEKHVFWWHFDEVLDIVEKDSDIPDNIYIYTIGSPWGFDPRDPMLEFMLEHHKEIFGEDSEIYYPKK